MKIEDLTKMSSGTFVGIGIGVAAPFLITGITKASRPALKALMHGYLDLADKVKEMSAETKERWSDLIAEVQTERQQKAAATAAAVTAAATAPAEAETAAATDS
jgi:hypothetical protein